MYLAGNVHHIAFLCCIRHFAIFILLVCSKKLLSLTVRTVYDGCGVMYRKDLLLGPLRCPDPYAYPTLSVCIAFACGLFCVITYHCNFLFCCRYADKGHVAESFAN